MPSLVLALLLVLLAPKAFGQAHRISLGGGLGGTSNLGTGQGPPVVHPSDGGASTRVGDSAGFVTISRMSESTGLFTSLGYRLGTWSNAGASFTNDSELVASRFTSHTADFTLGYRFGKRLSLWGTVGRGVWTHGYQAVSSTNGNPETLPPNLAPMPDQLATLYGGGVDLVLVRFGIVSLDLHGEVLRTRLYDVDQSGVQQFHRLQTGEVGLAVSFEWSGQASKGFDPLVPLPETYHDPIRSSAFAIDLLWTVVGGVLDVGDAILYVLTP